MVVPLWMMEKPLLEKMGGSETNRTKKMVGWTSMAHKVTKLFPAIFPPFSFLVGFLKGGCSRGGGNWGTLRIPREDWGTLGKTRGITTPP